MIDRALTNAVLWLILLHLFAVLLAADHRRLQGFIPIRRLIPRARKISGTSKRDCWSGIAPAKSGITTVADVQL